MGADAGIEAMGEEVRVAGRAVRAVVSPVERDRRNSVGGSKVIIIYTMQVSLADGDEIADGDGVEGRMMKGKVDKKEHHGGGWIITVGSENRYDDDF